MSAQRRLALVTDEPVRRREPRLTRRRVTLVCQECGTQHTYTYPGTGPYRAFCKRCK